ncbi:MAG: hypothetical protein COW65_10435 [Cytophagales bacterium CG18_big_fil_WC_8_21_14_2_50_42_9]|nr:MAG: hypothetical protein COW65_10435 [Cytophagales bacterium CG18_big_fil_WC_8_21_14_2_50_42_9]
MQEQHLDFYQLFFTENLFLVPDMNSPAYPEAALPPATADDDISGDTLPAKRYNLLGQNRKGLIITVALLEKEFQALPSNEFLTKVLVSIKHTLSDVAFVNLEPKEKLDIYLLSKETQINNLLVFGPGLLDMDANSKVHLYKPASIGNIPLLIADVLATIENDVNKKKLLWSGLQAVFLK